MDVNYFLLMRKKYDTLVQQLDFIIETYKEIKEIKEFKENQEFKESSTHSSSCFYTEEKKRITQLREDCNHYIYSLCNHDFVSDTIDVHPEKTVTIVYCSLCELTQK